MITAPSAPGLALNEVKYCLLDHSFVPMAISLQVEELAKSKLEKPKRLQQQAHRDWQEIKHGSLKFQRRQQEAHALRQLTKADLSSFFQVSCDSTSVDKLCMCHLCCCQAQCQEHNVTAQTSFGRCETLHYLLKSILAFAADMHSNAACVCVRVHRLCCPVLQDPNSLPPPGMVSETAETQQKHGRNTAETQQKHSSLLRQAPEIDV